VVQGSKGGEVELFMLPAVRHFRNVMEKRLQIVSSVHRRGNRRRVHRRRKPVICAGSAPCGVWSSAAACRECAGPGWGGEIGLLVSIRTIIRVGGASLAANDFMFAQ
jgi:hypothetical protein